MSNWHRLHYNKVAAQIRKHRTLAPMRYGSRAYVAKALLNEMTLEWTVYFKEDSKDFNQEKFIKACGFMGGEK
jgi:hypothetical protein